jgi:hypothetical protein
VYFIILPVDISPIFCEWSLLQYSANEACLVILPIERRLNYSTNGGYLIILPKNEPYYSANGSYLVFLAVECTVLFWSLPYYSVKGRNLTYYSANEALLFYILPMERYS